MPCPKCGGIQAKEDGVVFCENPACFHVVERKGDPEFDSKIETSPTEKRGRPKSVFKKEPKYKRGIVKGQTCTVEGCNKPVFAKGLCRRCYYQKRLRNRTQTILRPRPHILDVLQANGIDVYKIYCEAGGISEAINKLGISRSTLHVWLNIHGLKSIYRAGPPGLSQYKSEEKDYDISKTKPQCTNGN